EGWFRSHFQLAEKSTSLLDCRLQTNQYSPGLVPFAKDHPGSPVLSLHILQQRFRFGACRKCADLNGKRVSSASRRNAELVQPDTGDALHDNGLCRAMGEVNNAVLNKRTTIVDSNLDALLIDQVLNPDLCAERKSAVRCRHLFHVEGLAAGCEPALKLLAIPAGNSEFSSAGLSSGLFAAHQS